VKEQIVYDLLSSSVESLKESNDNLSSLDKTMQKPKKWTEYGFSADDFTALEKDMVHRLGGRALDMGQLTMENRFPELTMDETVTFLSNRLGIHAENPIVVYVDDEEENLFIFKRKFSKDLRIRTFANPREALSFIKVSSEVALVITDEVMPGLMGNDLCDQVKAVKPFMPFILITGNPENDEGLMYRSLRHNRFYEFIQKPVDFDGKKDQYLDLFKNIMQRLV